MYILIFDLSNESKMITTSQKTSVFTDTNQLLNFLRMEHGCELPYNYMEAQYIYAVVALAIIYVLCIVNNTMTWKATPWARGEERPIPFQLYKLVIITDIFCCTMFFLHFLLLFINPSNLVETEKFVDICEWTIMEFFLHISILMVLMVLAVMSAYDYMRFLITRHCRWPMFLKIIFYFYMVAWTVLNVCFVAFKFFFYRDSCPRYPYSMDYSGRAFFISMYGCGLLSCVLIYLGASAYQNNEQSYLLKNIFNDDIFRRRYKEIKGFIRDVNSIFYVCMMHCIGLLPAALLFILYCEGCYYELCETSTDTRFWIYFNMTLFVLLKSAIAPVLYYYRIDKVKNALNGLKKKLSVKITFTKADELISVNT